MDYVSRQFINLVKKLRKDLRKAIEKHTEAIGQSTKAVRENKLNPLPIPLPVVAELQFPESEQTQQRTRYRQSHAVQLFIAAATWGTFLAAGFYGAVTFNQWAEMRAQTDLIHHAAQKSRRDVANQLRIAQQQITLAQEQMMRDQRAWLGAKIIMDKPETAYFFTYTTKFRNYGKSPALHIQAENSGHAYGSDFPKHPYYGTVNPLEIRSQAPLFPGEDGGIPGTAHIPLVDYREMLDGKEWWYTYGFITYDDVFEKPHTTHFCLRHGINPPNNKPVLCRTYNDAD